MEEKLPKSEAFPKRLLIFLSIIAFFGFVVLSYFVSQELFIQLDFDSTVILQDNISSIWDLPFSFLSVLGSAEISGLIWFGLLIFSVFKKYWLTISSLFLFLVATFIEILGKIFIIHPSPPHLFYRGVIDFTLPSHYVSTDYSYPSGHITRTAFLIIFFIILVYINLSDKYRLIFIPGLILLMGLMVISRIYLGEHWLSDVLGGILLGGSLGIFSAASLPIKKIKHAL